MGDGVGRGASQTSATPLDFCKMMMMMMTIIIIHLVYKKLKVS
jgi:hypothetical protein